MALLHRLSDEITSGYLITSLAKRKSLSVKEKVAVSNALNDGMKNSSVCEQFGLSQSKVSTIWKSPCDLLDAHKNGITSAKRFQLCKKTDLMKHCCNGFKGKVKQEPQSSALIHNTATDEMYRHINAIAAVNVEMHAKVAEDDPNEGLIGGMVHNTSVPQRFLVKICIPANKLINGPYAILYTSMIQHSHSVSLSLGRVDPYTLVKSSSVIATSSNEIRGWRKCHRFGTTIPCRSVARSRNTAGRV
ncbi:hypothetical protein T05_869 [Trichinella murrelli]|uniref:Tigger transposable element-derived protein 4 n=1 Tax=Trichinella murrelli TaxID=144512 RepID=A0A0V0T988_9BILA|nr:hypothetical protein T05_869 [Trichinella murrelli]